MRARGLRIFSNQFYLLVILSVFLCSSKLSAQEINYSPEDFFDNKDGLSQGTINCIAQDRHGYLWFGTQDGLNKFDGITFEVFKHDEERANNISDNFINALEVDLTGDLWIGTRSGGLNKYNIETGVFQYYNHDPDKDNSIGGDWVSSIAQTSDGTIWVGTMGGGLNKLNVNSDSFERYVNNQDDKSSISSDNVNCLFVDLNDILWIGTDSGLNKFNAEKKTFQRYQGHSVKGFKGPSNDVILSLWSNDVGILWVGTNGGGLNLMNVEDESFESYHNNSQTGSSVVNNQIMSILGKEENTLWIGTDGGGLYTFNMESKKYTPFKVAFPRVKSIYRDASSDVWVGLRGGLNRIDHNSDMFKVLSTDLNDELIAKNGDIHALCVDQHDFIWSGSSVDGLKKINRKTLETTTYIHSEKPTSLSSTGITFLYVDKQETIWVGTDNGLNRYNSQEDTFTRFISTKNDPESISPGRINYIYEDSKDNFWVCTRGGLNILNRGTGNFKALDDNIALSSNDVSVILEDDQGVYWIGFSSAGFDRYDSKNKVYKHYYNDMDNPNSLSNDRVSHMYDDGKNLWIATYGGGLNKFDKESETFIHYDESDGLANSSLYCVLSDEFGNLWMSHNEGISKFDTESTNFKNYFEDEEFNSRAYYKNDKGEIFLGGFYIVSFFSENVVDNDLVPPVHINEFRLFNEVVNPLDEYNLLTRVPEETDTIILNHDQNFFSFGLVVLNYADAESNKLKYKLENFDSEWNDASEFRYANYTNVPPGEYTFKVVGSNNSSLWNESGDYIHIVILTPWWNSLVFKISLLLVIATLLVLLYRFRIRSIKKQKDDLELIVKERTREVLEHQQEIIDQKENITDQNNKLIALNEEKNELIQIVAHDLRSPLNQIKGLASIIKMINPDLNKETVNSIDLIDDLVDRQRSMIGKVLDTNAIDANKLNMQLVVTPVKNIVDEVLSTMAVVADNKNIEIKTIFSDDKLQIKVDKNYLIQILENILSNAIKFSSRNKEVIIKVISEDTMVRISVKDQGPGVTKKDMKFLFDRYTKLTAKPTNNEDSSGLGLAIAKKYVEAMNGKIWCESEPGDGALFLIEFAQIN